MEDLCCPAGGTRDCGSIHEVPAGMGGAGQGAEANVNAPGDDIPVQPIARPRQMPRIPALVAAAIALLAHVMVIMAMYI